MKKAYYTSLPNTYTALVRAFLRPTLLSVLLAAGSAQAQVTGIQISNVSNPFPPACGDVQADINFLGTGDICVKATIQQGANTGETGPIHLGAIPFPMPAFPLGSAPWSGAITDPNADMVDGEFTLTISAGLDSTFPNCDTVTKTVKVTSCSAPALAGGGGGSAAPVPTMGEVGLLLSGLALAGAAVPALRRREKRRNG